MPQQQLPTTLPAWHSDGIFAAARQDTATGARGRARNHQCKHRYRCSLAARRGCLGRSSMPTPWLPLICQDSYYSATFTIAGHDTAADAREQEPNHQRKHRRRRSRGARRKCIHRPTTQPPKMPTVLRARCCDDTLVGAFGVRQIIHASSAPTAARHRCSPRPSTPPPRLLAALQNRCYDATRAAADQGTMVSTI